MRERIMKIEVSVRYPFQMKELLLEFVTFGILTWPHEMKKWGEYNLVLYDDGLLELIKIWRKKQEIIKQEQVHVESLLHFIKNNKKMKIEDLKLTFWKKRMFFFNDDYYQMYQKLE